MIGLLRRRAFERFSTVQDFVAVLMKPRNGQAWTAEDRAFLKDGLKALARWSPALVLFLVPGGFVLLAGYAWLLDRRGGSAPVPDGRRKTDRDLT